MNFAFPNIIFVFLLAIVTGYLTFLTTKGGLTDNRFSTPWKRLTKRGRYVFFALLAIGSLLILQEWNNQAKGGVKEEEAKRERNNRDSIITRGINHGVDSVTKKLYDDISKAFAKQGLRLDTVTKNVERIRDSVGNTIYNYSQPDPVILIDGNGIYPHKDSVKGHYGIRFISLDAGSTNFNLNSYFLSEFNDNTCDVSKLINFPKTLRLYKNGKWETGFFESDFSQVINIYIFIKGTYTTLDGTKVYPLENLYRYNLKSNHVDILVGELREKIIKIIKSIPEKEFKNRNKHLPSSSN